MKVRDADPENRYQVNMFVSVIGVVFLGGALLNAVWQERFALASVLLVIVLITAGSMLTMRFSGRHAPGTFGLSVGVFFAFSYLLASGGVDNTGPLWCFPIIAIATFVNGFRHGVMVVLALMAIALVILYVPGLPFEVAEYGMAFKARFVAALTALSALCLVYEFMRQRSRQRYQALSQFLHKASLTDELTGLVNRRGMRERLQSEHENHQQGGDVFSVIMVDLDHFKQVNDRYGHAVGDALLVESGHRLKNEVRRRDVVARWGGEEFLVLLPGTELGDAVRVAEKLRRAIADLDLTAHGLVQPVSASFGVHSVAGGGGISELLGKADELLYQAKRGGRNRVESVKNGAPEKPAVSAAGR